MQENIELKNTSNKFGDKLKLFFVCSFLIVSFFWFFWVSDDFRFVAGLLLSLPQLFCAEWLFKKYKKQISMLSVEHTGFSFYRILIGSITAIVLLLGLLVFAVKFL